MADASALPDIPRPSQLWKHLSPDKKRVAADAFWRDEQAANEQAEAIGLIAQRIKFRVKSVLAMPVEKKSHYVLAMPAVSEAMAARLLVAYHLEHQRPMMGAFLDALGITHENGVIQEDDVKPEEAKLAPAVDAIEKAYPAEDVSLYLNVLLCQDPGTWGGLRPIIDAKGWG